MNDSEQQLKEVIEGLQAHLPPKTVIGIEAFIKAYGNLRVAEANVERLMKEAS